MQTLVLAMHVFHVLQVSLMFLQQFSRYVSSLIEKHLIPRLGPEMLQLKTPNVLHSLSLSISTHTIQRHRLDFSIFISDELRYEMRMRKSHFL